MIVLDVWTPPGDRVLGMCSICGGNVTAPEAWWGVVPPTPTCQSCGAVARDAGAMPVIPMVPLPPPTTEIIISTSEGPHRVQTTTDKITLSSKS